MLRRVNAYWEPTGAVLEEWAARIQAEHARMVDAAARVPILAGRSRVCRARLLQGAGTIVLLALGLLVGRTVAWVLLGFPMTVLVWLFLVDIAERREAPDETQADDGGFADATTVWSSVPLDEGSPIIIVRPDRGKCDESQTARPLAGPYWVSGKGTVSFS
jgi:hypothetical protein